MCAKQTIVTIITPEGFDYDFLVSKSPFVVGRSGLTDLHLPATVVSNRHFRVELGSDSGSVVITDLFSKNGTIADKQMLDRGQPTSFDLPVELEIVDIRLRISLVEQEDDAISLSLEQSHSMSRLLLNSMMRAKVAQFRAKMSVERGTSRGEDLVLSDTAKLTRLGGTDADLPLREPAVAHVPLVVSLVGAAYHLEPHPTAKVTVGKQRVEQPIRLRDGDRIRVGGTVLRFSDPIEDAVDEMEENDPRPAMVDAAAAGRGESSRAIRHPWTTTERILFAFSIVVIALSAITLLVFLGVIPM